MATLPIHDHCSLRYNSADGWLRDSVWVARTEHLESLLAGVARWIWC